MRVYEEFIYEFEKNYGKNYGRVKENEKAIILLHEAYPL